MVKYPCEYVKRKTWLKTKTGYVRKRRKTKYWSHPSNAVTQMTGEVIMSYFLSTDVLKLFLENTPGEANDHTSMYTKNRVG